MKKATPRKPPPRKPASAKPKKATPVGVKPAKVKPEKAKPAAALPRDYAREPGLEAAIIAAPLDPVPRMVYADWLEGVGDRRGEWMALHSAIEREPKNLRLRSLAVEFLGKHHKLLVGDGASRLLPAAWIGWRGGFVDEIRVQPFDGQRGAVASLAQLLAHPSCRFVRCVGIGEVAGLQDTIDVLADAQLPLLETVVVCDTERSSTPIDIDRLAKLETLTQLGLCNTGMATAMPQLRGLTFRLGARCEDWVASGGCANLESLSIDCRGLDSPAAWIGKMLAAVPRLRRLRLLHLRDADAIVEHLRRFDDQLEYLDLSHSSLSTAGADQLRGAKLHLVAMRRCFGTAVEKLEERLASVATSPSDGNNRDLIEDDRGETGSWLHHMVEVEGRDALATIPGVGHWLFSIGTHHNIDGNAARATSLLDASLTFPSAAVKTWPWANAAIAHERVLELDEAELIAREGLLRTPKEPNLYAIIIDALRRTNRNEQALALLPKALATITAPRGSGAHHGGPAACLADCLLVLAQAGRHRDLLALAKEHVALFVPRPDMHAIVAMSQVALGKGDAQASLKKATHDRPPGLRAHARAALALAARAPRPDRALAALAEAKAARYPEWHWIASDPNLARLHGTPGFTALLGE